MKLQTNEREVTTEGLAEVSNFRIAVNGKAFKILLDGLYANKIGAVVRELCTNAYDAHVAVNKGATPFQVRLPTVFEPVFAVRDFGVSMTHEQVFNLYTTVFESSKDASNQQTGMLGLGSKSPFAYVDTFNVTAWKDGKKRVYSAFIGGEGIPQIALFSEEDSDEDTGVEVSIAVQSKDVQAFATNAERILKWFPTRPEIVGGKLTFADQPIKDEGKGWRLFESNRYGYDTKALARQGCVVYPLDANAIPNVTPAHKSLLDSPLLIDFPIGSLNVAANREALSYDAHTCKNILARLNSLTKEIADKHAEEILKAPTLWEAARKFNDFAKARLPRAIIDSVGTAKWKGQHEVRGSKAASAVLHELSISDPDHGVVIHYRDRYRCQSRQSLPADSTTEYAGNRLQVHYGSAVDFYVRIVDKQPNHEGIRLKKAYDESPNDEGLVLIVAKDEALAQRVIDAFGNPPFRYTHDLEKVEYTRDGTTKLRGTTKKTQVKVRKFDTNQNKAGDEVVVDLDGDAYYFFTMDGRILNASGARSGTAPYDTWDLRKCLDAVRKLGIASDAALAKPVYFVSVVYQKRVEEHKEWVNLAKLIESRVDDFKDAAISQIVANKMHNALQNNKWVGYCDDTALKAYASRAKGRASAFLNLFQNVDSMRQKQQTANAAVSKLTIGNTNTPVPDGISDYLDNMSFACRTKIDALREQIFDTAEKDAKVVDVRGLGMECEKAYPLLDVVSYRLISLKPQILEYIEAIDLLKEKREAEAKANRAKIFGSVLSIGTANVVNSTTVAP